VLVLKKVNLLFRTHPSFETLYGALKQTPSVAMTTPHSELKDDETGDGVRRDAAKRMLGVMASTHALRY
jgi:hypothetical protein